MLVLRSKVLLVAQWANIVWRAKSAQARLWTDILPAAPFQPDEDHAMGFTDTFLLRQEGDQWLIFNHMFRLHIHSVAT